MWYLYVLECKDGSYYAGITTDVARRVNEHNTDTTRASKYAWSRRPVRLLKTWEYKNRSTASKAEYAFKKLKKSDKRARINDPRPPIDY